MTTLAVATTPPESVKLSGIIRDFKQSHPDFEVTPEGGFAHYAGIVGETITPNTDPVFVGPAKRVVLDWKDSAGRPICPTMFDPAMGDSEGMYSPNPSDGGVTSAETFGQWYKDALGVNMSRAATIILHRQTDGTYLFDDTIDAGYAGMGGFFPIDGHLFGNEGNDHNYHFTFELHGKFVYDALGGQFFAFKGDDDIWVYIDGKLVIDIGGIHSTVDQYIDVSRLGLSDGQVYQFDFFYAERHTTAAAFRMTTNLPLISDPTPPTLGMFD